MALTYNELSNDAKWVVNKAYENSGGAYNLETELAKLTPDEQKFITEGYSKYNPATASAQEKFDRYSTIYKSQNPFLKDVYSAALSGRGGTNMMENRYYTAYKTAVETLGRDITPTEFAKIYPTFEGENGLSTGTQYVANLADQEAKSPTALAKKSGEYSGQVGQLFKSFLGRDATADELQHFGSMLATKETDAYELGNFLKQTPEYLNTQDTAFRKDIAAEMEPLEQDVFNKGKEQVLADYTKRGIQHSPALDFAITNMMGDIAKNRTGFLTQLKASQYGGNKESARADYGATLNNYMNTINQNRQSQNNMLNALVNRSWDAQDYDVQKRDYFDSLSKSKWSPGTYDWINLGLNAVGAGAKAYTAFK